MTNEEIERKFEFELSIGLFKHSIRYPDEILFKRGSRTYKLLKLLTNIGFVSDEDSLLTLCKESYIKELLESRNGVYLEISMKDRIVDIDTNWNYLNPITQTTDFNEIPRYVKDYQI